MPRPSRTRNCFLKAAATARAGKSHRSESSLNNAGNLVVELLTDSGPENEDVSQVDCVDKVETFECDWDGSVNHQPEDLQPSCNRSVFFFLSNLRLDYILSYRM